MVLRFARGSSPYESSEAKGGSGMLARGVLMYCPHCAILPFTRGGWMRKHLIEKHGYTEEEANAHV